MRQTYGIYHIVERGQTLYRISKSYNVDINQVMRLNKIIDPTQIDIGQRIFIPGVRLPVPIEPYKSIPREAIKKLVGLKSSSSDWHYITLHHSATHEGNAVTFDRNHRSRRMGGLFYHFVIGNGTLSGDGEIEVGWRWKKQEAVNRPADIQICLVGNFNEEKASRSQHDALIKLVSVLREQYGISMQNIRRHKDIEGKATECPGESFPFNSIIAELKKNR
jgi:LysM repeat protein